MKKDKKDSHKLIAAHPLNDVLDGQKDVENDELQVNKHSHVILCPHIPTKVTSLLLLLTFDLWWSLDILLIPHHFPHT
jgi:hypothetical protein